jgi:hypothetical protein
MGRGGGGDCVRETGGALVALFGITFKRTLSHSGGAALTCLVGTELRMRRRAHRIPDGRGR